MSKITLEELIKKSIEQGYESEYKFKDKRLVSSRRSYEAQEVNIDSLTSLKKEDTNEMLLFYRLKTIDGFKGYFINNEGLGADLSAAQFLTDIQKE